MRERGGTGEVVARGRPEGQDAYKSPNETLCLIAKGREASTISSRPSLTGYVISISECAMIEPSVATCTHVVAKENDWISIALTSTAATVWMVRKGVKREGETRLTRIRPLQSEQESMRWRRGTSAATKAVKLPRTLVRQIGNFYPQGLVSVFAALSTMEAAIENEADELRKYAAQCLQVLLDVVENVEPDAALFAIVSFECMRGRNGKDGTHRIVGGSLPVRARSTLAHRWNSGGERGSKDDEGEESFREHGEIVRG